MRSRFKILPLGLAMAGLVAACTMKNQDAPALGGPSEFGTSVMVAVSPDVLTQDGASQSTITVTARDSGGAPVRSLSLRSEIWVEGRAVDFGSLSARNIVTDTTGRATLVYTAPAAAAPSSTLDVNTTVSIAVTPIGSDYANSVVRFASIRLVPPAGVTPSDGLRALFTVNPAAPVIAQIVSFNGSSSRAGSGRTIVSYGWDFGDGDQKSGSTATTTHDFVAAGTYPVTLTVKDDAGGSAAAVQIVHVSAGGS